MNNLKYCAAGEEGIEFVADTEKEVQEWINDEVAGIGHSDSSVPKDYYQIVSMTEVELDALPEV